MVYPEISTIIREMGMKQKKVAQRAEMTEHRLSKIIHGRAKATVEELGRLARVLGVNIADLENVAPDADG